MLCLLQVRRGVGGSSLVTPGAPGVSRGFAGVGCLVRNCGASGRPRRCRSPLVARCSPYFLPSPVTYMPPESALNTPVVLANAALFLDVVDDAGTYVLSCFAAARPACGSFEYFP